MSLYPGWERVCLLHAHRLLQIQFDLQIPPSTAYSICFTSLHHFWSFNFTSCPTLSTRPSFMAYGKGTLSSASPASSFQLLSCDYSFTSRPYVNARMEPLPSKQPCSIIAHTDQQETNVMPLLTVWVSNQTSAWALDLFCLCSLLVSMHITPQWRLHWNIVQGSSFFVTSTWPVVMLIVTFKASVLLQNGVNTHTNISVMLLCFGISIVNECFAECTSVKYFDSYDLWTSDWKSCKVH